MQEKDAIEIYENGKHRRYALLFAVNGGAFAVARLLAGQPADVGGLTQGMLSAGMAAFTIVMAYDIWQFGLRMRAENGRLFGAPGQVVLAAIGGLITLGWIMVAHPGACRGV